MTESEPTGVMTVTTEFRPAAMSDSCAEGEVGREDRVFDGVICFGGEDWWYHNRGHYDMQMMRRLAKRVPVLYINSIGMRTPRLGEGAMFFTRVKRKLKSLRRGMVTIEPGFTVFSPVAAPGRIGKTLNPTLLPLQIRRAARRLGMRAPLLWVACPPGAAVAPKLKCVATVYQRTDRYEEYSGVDPDLIGGYDQSLKRDADLTVFCSTLLHEQEGSQCRRSFYADHGVDYDRFAGAGEKVDEPDDIRQIPRPRIGFIGGIDSHTFDPAFFLEVARSLSDLQLVLVGACSLPENWCRLPNVSLLGQKPYEEVARYMASCDVLIMPWNRNEWIEACNPVKLKEYLAVGRPIVTTPFYELKRYDGFVRIADTPQDFAHAIRDSLAGVDAARLRRRVESETWDAKAQSIINELQRIGVRTSNAPNGAA